MSSRVDNRVPQAMERLIRSLSDWTGKSADQIKKRIIELGDQPKSGNPGSVRMSSAPGEPWANQSRELGESFGKETEILKTTLGSKLWLAQMETGIVSRDGKVLIEARPTVAKAIESELPTIENLLHKYCKDAEDPN